MTDCPCVGVGGHACPRPADTDITVRHRHTDGGHHFTVCGPHANAIRTADELQCTGHQLPVYLYAIAHRSNR